MSNKGLTIIELLIALVLLGVLTTAVLAPLTGLFQLTGRSTQTLSATTQAQEIVEYLKGQWRTYPPPANAANPTPEETRALEALRDSRNRYDRTCVENFPNVREGLSVSVTVWELDNDADRGNRLTLSRRQSCGRANVADPPPMKRVSVVVTTNSADNTASLTADIARP